jgi:hypothetical protein
MARANPEDTRLRPVTDKIDAQIKRRTVNISRRCFQALTNRGRHHTGKRQRQVQIAGRRVCYAPGQPSLL